MSAGSVGGVVCRAKIASLDWLQIEAVDEAALETRPCGPREGTAGAERHAILQELSAVG